MSNISNGKQLRKFRKKNHLTQKQLAEFTHYSTSHIAHIEQENWPINERLSGILEQYDQTAEKFQSAPVTKLWISLYLKKEGSSYERALDELSLTLTELNNKDLNDIAPNEIKKTLEQINKLLKAISSPSSSEPPKTAIVKKPIRSLYN